MIIRTMRLSVFLHLILSYCLTISLSHSQFSPFDFLNNLFKPPRVWTTTRQQKELKSPVTRENISFRPHPTVSPTFIALQKDRNVLKSPYQKTSTLEVPNKVSVTKYPVIRTISPYIHSSWSSPTTIKPYTARTTFKTTTSDSKVINYSKTSKVRKEEDAPLKKKGNIKIIKDDSHKIVTPHSSYRPSHESKESGPNPGDFPIISLLDEPAVNYYEQVFQKPASSSPYNIISNIYKDDYNIYKDTSNPHYAPEEFTYNQDPILIDHGDADQDDFKEITQALDDDVGSVNYDSQFSINKDSLRYEEPDGKETHYRILEPKEYISTTKTPTTTLSSIFLEQSERLKNKENIPRSINFNSLSSHHNIIRDARDFTNLVNTIEYKPADIIIKNKKINYSTETLGSHVNCSESREVGFCSMTSSYPKELIESLYEHCSDIIEAFKAVVPEDVDTLGDNSESVISSEKDLARPWSWKVFAYKKKQLCSSDISFIQPSYAMDTEGNWNIILQTDRILQRVALDTCTKPGYPCTGIASCGKRSQCVQRFNHQLLLSVPSSTTSTTLCPSIRAFKFPSGCVCHGEISDDKESDIHAVISIA